MPGFEQKFKSEFRALNLPAFIVPFDGSVFQMHVILSADRRQKEPRGEGRKREAREHLNSPPFFGAQPQPCQKYKLKSTRAGEVALWVKGLPCKHEHLS